MTQVPALKITITDDLTGVTYTDSVHRIIGTELNAETGECSFKIAIYASQESLESGKKPIILTGFNSYFIIPFTSTEIIPVLDAPLLDLEKLLTPRQINVVRARNFLQTLTTNKCPFDYAGTSTPITCTL